MAKGGIPHRCLYDNANVVMLGWYEERVEKAVKSALTIKQ